MIVWNTMIEKVDRIYKAVNNYYNIHKINVNAVVEPFNDGKEKGMLMFIYDKFNPDLDICIWTYLPSNRIINNQINVIIGKHSDCKANNLWNKPLPIKMISDNTAKELHKKTRDYIIEQIDAILNKDLDVSIKI